MKKYLGLVLIALVIVVWNCSGDTTSDDQKTATTAQEVTTVVTKASPLAKHKILMVIASKDFRDEELSEPKTVLMNAGAKIDIASTTKEPATGMLGAKVKPNTLIKEAKAEDYTAIIVVGGMGSKEYLWDNEVLHELLKTAAKADRVIGAICISPVVLAKAGLLNGKDATVYKYKETTEQFEKHGVNYKPDSVVVSGNIITANGPKAAKAFGETILKILVEQTKEPKRKEPEKTE